MVLVLVLAGGRLLGRFVGRCRSPVDGDIIRRLHHADKTTPLVRHRTFIPRPQPDTISAHYTPPTRKHLLPVTVSL